MADPVVAPVDLVQGGEEVVSIWVVFAYRLLFISPGGNMIHSPGIFDP
jgi:hypothetical protein